MSDDIVHLRIEEIESECSVTLDWQLLTGRDILDFRAAVAAGADALDQERRIYALVSKLAGQDALDLPALVLAALAAHVVDRLTGGGGDGAPSPNA